MSEATPFCSVKGDRLAVWPRRRDSLRRQSRLSRRGSIAASATDGAKLPVRIRGYYLSERKSTMLLHSTFSFWRRRRDSNPRAAHHGNTISSRARYDLFDTTPAQCHCLIIIMTGGRGVKSLFPQLGKSIFRFLPAD